MPGSGYHAEIYARNRYFIACRQGIEGLHGVAERGICRREHVGDLLCTRIYGDAFPREAGAAACVVVVAVREQHAAWFKP